MIKKFFFASVFGLASSVAYSQLVDGVNDLSGRSNVVSSAVPFLTIAADSRAGGMGEVGAATSPDVWSNAWNASKTAMNSKDMAIGVSYTPWLRNLNINDINLIYLTGFKKLKKDQAVSGAVRYFSLGSIEFTDASGQKISTYNPYEFAFDMAYSRKLYPNFSVGLAFRYIYTSLTGGIGVAGSSDTYKAGQALAADLSMYYRKELKNNMIYSAGLNISNIGSKVRYSASGKGDYLPANLRLGTGLEVKLDKYNSISGYVDLNKLLVPTPSYIWTDSSGNKHVIGGQDNLTSVPTSIFNSFSDAPGGFKEELHEWIICTGFEYWYDKQFGIRAGYFHEDETKGNRKFFTMGLGLRLSTFGLDFSYLVPTNGKNSPLANTLRFSLSFEFEKAKKSDENSQPKMDQQ